MKGDKLAHIHIRHAVAIGQEKILFLDVPLNAFHPAAGHGVEPGLGEGHVPVFFCDRTVQRQFGRGAQTETEIGTGQVVIEEVALDHPALVAEAQDEVLEAVVREPFHDVPENRPVADRDHRLGDVVGHVADARALASAQDDDFHSLLRSSA